MTITMDQVLNARLHHRGHLDGPRGKEGWFGDLHQCKEFPRLQRIVRYYRKDKSHAVEWQVDNQPVASLEAAVEALNKPVELTEGEQRAMDKVTDQYLDLRRAEGIELTDLIALSYKGLIEFEDGKCRRLP